MIDMIATRDMIATLERQIPKWMARENVPGLSVALIRDAQVIWRRGFGFKDNATREPVTPETIFQAASLSKPPTRSLSTGLSHKTRIRIASMIPSFAFRR